jgi:FkbH-like protein
MYESEANHRIELADQIPSSILSAMVEPSGNILSRTVLPWSEHCTECVWPVCYSTCDLYAPRADGRCRRFVDGMVRINIPTAANSYLLKIRFKRWGKLWTPGNIRLYSATMAEQLERRDHFIGSSLVHLPLPSLLKKSITGKRYSFKKRKAANAGSGGGWPTCFLIECYHPGSRPVQLSLTMRPNDAEGKISFQQLVELNPGFQRIRIPITEIASLLDLTVPFSIDIIPNGDLAETTLYFGLIEFVREPNQLLRQERADKISKIKCVIWDLDNTLWDGILVEDGAELIRLKPEIDNILKTLDERGILLSVASKNNTSEALDALKRFGIVDYFLCPQISWNPKSESVSAIARSLNIGLDTLMFVDDSDFELEQVRAMLPQVQTLKADSYLSILALDCCQVPVTEESRARRRMYQVESQRQIAAQTFAHDYLAFLRDCDIRLEVHPMTEENLDRVYELTQRTNQMNFSGNRYEKATLRRIIATPYLDTYVLRVEDRFGSYGIIGFSIVDNREPCMTDLMFSCRVQSKRVEHAFLSYILGKYISESGKDFHASYRKTARNAPSGRVFADLGMEEIGVQDGVTNLIFHKHRQIPDDHVIHVLHQDPLLSVK